MPTDGCFVYMHIIIINSKLRSVEQDSVPYMMKVIHRADMNRVLRSSHPPKPNLAKAELKVLAEIRKDSTRIVLTADKGVAMVVMDKKIT